MPKTSPVFIRPIEQEGFWKQQVIVLFLSVSFTLLASPKQQRQVTQQNVMVELSFSSTKMYSDPFNQVTLDVLFTDPKGAELRVPAFWASTDVWKVRYASPIVGTHRFRSECSDSHDQGLHGITGVVEIQPYTGTNP